MRTRLSTSALLYTVALPPLLILGLFFVVPLCYLLFVSFMTNSGTSLFELKPTIENYTGIFTDSFYLLIIQRTLLSTAVVLALCLLLGYPVAFFAARLSPRGRIIMLLMMMVPLMV